MGYRFWPLDQVDHPSIPVRYINLHDDCFAEYKIDPGSRSLARRLDGYPLALATAGAFLRQSAVDCTTYLQRYEEVWQVSRTRVSQLPEYPHRTLYTTWSLSLAQVEAEIPEAAQLLAFLAYFDHQDIWYELFNVAEDIDQPWWFTKLARGKFVFMDAMTVLKRYCLVETHHDTDSYSLHTCVHDWTLDGLNAEINWSQYWLAFDCVASHIGAEDWDYLAEIRYKRFVGHARRLVHNRFKVADDQHDSVQVRLDQIEDLATLLREQVQFNAGEQMFLLAVAAKERGLGVDHTSTLFTVHNLGNLYTTQGRLDEAERMYNRALTGKEKALGIDHMSTLCTVHNLGILYTEQGRLDEAEQMYNRALTGKEKALGIDHMSTLCTVHNLGGLYVDQGRLDEAEQMYKRALTGKEKALGIDHTSTLRTKLTTGNLLCLQGQLLKAERMYQDAMSGFQRVLGPDHIHILGTANNIGNLYSMQHKWDEAKEMYEQAGMRRALGENHYFVYGVVNNRGVLSADRRESDAALRMYEEAREGFERLLGFDHPLTKMVRYNIRRLSFAKTQVGSILLDSTGVGKVIYRARTRWYYN
jgi:tetratricopeptide (TPR) repeat protein